MPLEDQLTAIGNALNRIANALEQGAKPIVSVKTAAVETTTVEVEAPKPKAAKPKPAAPEPKAETPPPAAKPDAPITVNDLRDAAQKLLQAGRVKDIVAINTRLGVKRISEAPPEKYAEIMAALNEALATDVTPAQA